MVVGANGNVAPGEISGGEVWEEVDLTNFPTDWVVGDRFKIIFSVGVKSSDPYYQRNTQKSNIVEFYLTALNTLNVNTPLDMTNTDASPSSVILRYIYGDAFNSTNSSAILFQIGTRLYSGSTGNLFIEKSNLATYVIKILRLKN